MKWWSLVSIALIASCAPQSSSEDEIRGLRTVVYIVTDVDRARQWYTDVLGYGPYFDEPYYVGFQVGDFELGLDPDTSHVAPGPGGTTVFWEVEDAEATYERLLALGATAVRDVEDVGGGVRVGTVGDPFGNHFGIIEIDN